MNFTAEQFIKDYFATSIAQYPDDVLQRTRSMKLDSVDALVDFLLTKAGFSEVTMMGYKRRQFFAHRQEYAEINRKLEERTEALLKKMEEVKDDPESHKWLSYFLSSNRRSGAVSVDKNDHVVTLACISGDVYNNIEWNDTVPDDVPIYDIELKQSTGMKLKFFGDFPLIMPNGVIVPARELVRKASRYFRKTDDKNKPLIIDHAISDLSGTPILAYDYGRGIVLATPEFKGKKGKVFWAQNSHSTRAIFTIRGERIVEYKGARHDLLSKNLFPVSLSPPGVCSLASVQTEEQTVKSLSDLLPYKVMAIDLKYKVPILSLDNPESTDYMSLGLLKRKGHLRTFAPHLRMIDFALVPFAWLLTEHGFDFAKSFYVSGYQLGKAHSRLIYPRFLVTDNIDIFGNMIDLEGTISNDSFWKMFSEWSARSIHYSNGNPVIAHVRVEYELLPMEEGYGAKPKIVKEYPNRNQPKNWKELRKLVNAYGVRMYEMPSFFTTLQSLAELFSAFDGNQFLKGKQQGFFDVFLDGYRDANDDSSACQLVELIRPVPELSRSGKVNLDLLHDYFTKTPGILPYIKLPVNFQFVDNRDMSVVQ